VSIESTRIVDPGVMASMMIDDVVKTNRDTSLISIEDENVYTESNGHATVTVVVVT